MKLHWSPRSPYVRKVMIVAHETGVVGRLRLHRSVASMTEPNEELMHDNPLSKIPTLVLDDGTALYDSVVICEYLDSLHGGGRLFPAAPDERWHALRLHALADGVLDLLILWRNELMRPLEMRSAKLLAAFSRKLEAALAALAREIDGNGAFTIGHVAAICALGYLDFRFADIAWRNAHPGLAAWYEAQSQRASVMATHASDDSTPQAKTMAGQTA
jgi:glutathione S-transferase